MASLPPPRPTPIKDRASILFVEREPLDVLDGAFVVVDRNGAHSHSGRRSRVPDARAGCTHLTRGRRACGSGRLSLGLMDHIEDGDAIIAWATPSDNGYAFETCGANRCIPVDLDGMKLVSYVPAPPVGSKR